jgi:ATP-dependent RNA helicase DeaD
VEIKKSRINSDLNEIINGGNHKNFIATAETLLKDKDPVETVAAILKYAMESELDEKKYKDISEIKVKPRGTARLFVSLGEKDGLTPRKLIKLINNESKVSAGKITEVRIMDSFSFLTVPFEEAEIILKTFNEKSDQGKPLIQRANPSVKTGARSSGSSSKKTARPSRKR